MSKGLGAYEMSRLYSEYLRRKEDESLDTSRGTLWWVKEEVWKDAADVQRLDYGSAREGHPGLSIRSPKKPAGATIPMLYGSSSKARPTDWNEFILVRGLDEQNPSHLTYFGQVFAPVCISRQQIHRQRWTPGHVAYPVPGKPRLDADEQSQLDRYISFLSQPKKNQKPS